MVAIVAGNGLGLFNASNNILGGGGVLGLGALGLGTLGQSGARALVNAATGNLILQFQDEMLSGRGADLLKLRTYNSRGGFEGDVDVDGNAWRWDGERTVKFSGTAGQRNVAGTVTRTAGDGHRTDYTWDSVSQRYINPQGEGEGAHDSVRYDSAANEWVWTDGSSRLQERYANSVGGSTGRLQSQVDVSGNKITFTYDGSGRLIEVTDVGHNQTSGQKIRLVYTGTQLDRVETFQLAVDGTSGRVLDPAVVGATPVKQVEYLYDNGRIGTVKTILNPGGATPSYFSTTYTYLSTSGSLISKVSQSDGLSVDFTYDAASGRVLSVADASGTLRFDYVSATRTDITDGNGQVWSYIYDSATKQLKEIRRPAPAAGGSALVTAFSYDASGNVERITDARGKAVVYGYDPQGNRTLERDAEGNTITRTYDSANQLATETRYTVEDPDGAGAELPSGALTSRYVYDEQSRLRFVVSAEGRVTEHRYGTAVAGFGLLARTIQYATTRYDVSGLSATTPLTQTQLLAWLALGSTDKSEVQQTQYEYDLRGNLARRTDFAKVDAGGTGVLDAAARITEYIYSAHGELLQTIAIRGAARNQRQELTSYVYDGLGRELQRVNGSGTSTTVYSAEARTIQVTSATGLVETRAFDTAGRLVSVTHSHDSTSRKTEYVYDAAGQLRMVQDPQGGRRFSFYDAAGRLQYQVDSSGAVTGFQYDADGRVTVQTRYAKSVDTAGWVSVSGATPPAVTVDKTSLTVGTSGTDIVLDAAADRITRYGYDDAGRLETQTDAANVVTTTRYDGASRLTSQESGARVTRYFYDRDDRQVGVVDPLGYLTESKYDAAGRLVETVRYATRSPQAGNVSAPVWLGVTNGVMNLTAVGGRVFTQRLAAVDADGDELDFEVVGAKPAWLNLDKSGKGGVTLTGTPPKTLTDHAITVRALDQRGQSAQITVNISVVNTAPSWEVLADSVAAVNKSGYSLTLPAASDNESTTLTYSIVSGLPGGLGLSFDAAARTISGVPAAEGVYKITARVSDAQGAYTDRAFTLTVTGQGPRWSTEDFDRSLLLGQPFSFTVPGAVEPDGQALTYSIANKPQWLNLTVGAGGALTLSGTAPSSEGNFRDILLRAQDPDGNAAVKSFTLTVTNLPPVWTNSELPALRVLRNIAADYTPPQATDPEGEALTYSIVEGRLPAGLSLTDASQGRIRGTASEIGVFDVKMRVSDPHGGQSNRFLRIEVLEAAPVYNGGLPDPQDVQTGETVSVPITASMFTDANNDALTYTVRPNWMSISGQTISGRVPFVQPGEVRLFRITVTASDPQGNAVSAVFVLNATNPREPFLVAGGGSESQAQGAEGPARQAVLPPLTDVLSAWRPGTGQDDLHSYRYYDAQGRLVGSVDERGFLSEMVYDEQAHTQRNIQYLNDRLTVSATDTLDDLRADVAGAQQQTTQIEYDDRNRVIKSTQLHGTSGAIVTRNEYDSAGRLVRMVRAEGTSEARASRTRYNAFDEVTGTLGGEGDASGLALEAALAQYGLRHEYDSLGRRSKTIDANGSVTLFYYDSESRLSHTINAKGEVSETIYTAFGQAVSQRRYAKRLSSEALAALQAAGGGAASTALRSQVAALAVAGEDHLTQYQYDRRGLVARVTQKVTGSDADDLVTENSYSEFGQLRTQIRTILAGAGRTTTTQFDYDLRGALLSTTQDVGALNFNRQSAYDAFGRVIRSIDGAGNAVGTAYRDGGRAIEVTDPLNQMIRTEYDAFERVLKVTDARLQVTQYFYDDVARSVRVRTPEGVQVTTYSTMHGETLTVLDARGQTMRYTYDKDGRLKTVSEPVTGASDREVVHNTYDTSGRLTETRDARGIVTSFQYDALNRMFERRVDPSGLNLVTTYQFDAFGLQIRVREGVGNNQGANLARVTDYKYDRTGRLTHVILDPDRENPDHSTYTGLKLQTKYSYDGLGNTVRVDRGTLSSPTQHSTLYEFDNLGRRVKEIAAPSSVMGAGTPDTRDLTTQYRYDAAGRVSRKIDALGQSTWYVYDKAGQQTLLVNALGELSQSAYDENGRMTFTRQYATRLVPAALAALGDVVGESAVTPVVNANDRRTYRVYDKGGRQRYTLQNTLGTNWMISESRYDGNGNLTETRRYSKFLGEGRVTAIAAQGITVEEVVAELTTLGFTEAEGTLNKTQRTRFAYDASNRLRFTLDGTGSVSESVYDAAGNVVRRVNYAVRPTLTSALPSESEINAAVDRGNANNQVSQFLYDAAGRLRYSVQVTANDSEGQPLHAVSRQSYDALGRLVRTDSYAKAMRLADYNPSTLDAAVAASANQSSADRTSAFVYDQAGRQVYSVRVAGTDGQGQRVHVVSRQVYDALGQPVKSIGYAKAMVLADYALATLEGAVAQSGNNSAADRITGFAYDAAGRQTYQAQLAGANQAGQPLHVVSRVVYDALGQVMTTTTYATLMTLADYSLATFRSTVDLKANRSEQDRTTAFAYDLAGRQRFVVAADGSLSELVYNAFGEVKERRGFALSVTAPIAGMRHTEGSQSSKRGSRALGDGVTRGEQYEYDRVGRLLKSTDAQGFFESHSYDEVGTHRDFTNKSGQKWTYTYDRVGRLETEVSPQVSVQLSDESKPVLRSLTTRMEYDALGNLSKRIEAYGTVDARTTGYGYDRAGRQISTTLHGYYDPQAGKVVKVAAGATPPAGSFQRTVETLLDTFGNELRTKVRKGLDSYRYEYKTYDALGYLKHDIDALNHVVTFDYTVFGEQSTITQHGVTVSGTPANGEYWTAQEIAGKLAGDTQARTVTMLYDTRGLKKEVQQPQTSRYYQPLRQETVPERIETPLTRYEHNAFGEVTRESVKISPASGDHFLETLRDTWHYFDKAGRETLTIDALGYHTARKYDDHGNLREVIEYANASPLDETLQPRTPALNDQDRITLYTYNEKNQQTSIQRAQLRYTRLDGDRYVAVNNARDVLTTVATMTYDQEGRLQTRSDAHGNITTTTYSADGRVITTTELLRQTGAGGLDPFTAGAQVMAAPVTTLTLNAFGQVLASVRRPGGGRGETLVTVNEYDEDGQLISSIDANHARLDTQGTADTSDDVIVLESRAKDFAKRRRYDSEGRLTHETQAIDVTLGDWQRVQQTLERRYGYDAGGRQTDMVEVYQQARLNGDGSVALTPMQSGQRRLYNAFGEVREEYKIYGAQSAAFSDLEQALVARYDYDKTGWLLTKEAGDGRTEYFYDLAGQTTRQEQRGNGSDADGTGVRISEMGYDALGRLVMQRLPEFSAVTDSFSIRFNHQILIIPRIEQTFDRWGNVLSRSQGSYHDLSGNIGALDSTQKRTTRYDYNHDNQVIAEYLPTVSATRADGTTYQVNLTHALDYDLLGRSVQERELADDAGTAGIEAAQLRVRSKQFNEAGQLTAEVSAIGVRKEYAYDAHGNRIGMRTVSNLGQVEAVFVTDFDRNGNRISHGMLRTDEIGGQSRADLHHYQYDQANREVACTDFIEVGLGYTTFTQYDERNQVRAKRTPLVLIGHGPGIVTEYGYNEFGSKRFEKAENGNNLEWGYAYGDLIVGRLSGTVAGGRVTLYDYNDFGQVMAERYTSASGVSSERGFTYYQNGLVSAVTDRLAPFGTRGLADGMDYTLATDTTRYVYSANGERVLELYSREGEVEEPVYGNNGENDGVIIDTRMPGSVNLRLNRLTRTTYDAHGRVTQVEAPPQQHNLGDNQLTSVSYRYDELGNVRNINASYQTNRTASSDKWYTYNVEGQMTLADGYLINGQIVIGDRNNLGAQGVGSGTAITYNSLGQRATTRRYVGIEPNDRGLSMDRFYVELYGYDALGYLQTVHQTVNLRRVDTGTESDGTLQLKLEQDHDLRGSVTLSKTYSDLSTSRIWGLLSTTTSQYHEDGRLRFQTKDIANGTENDVLVSYTYDPAGILKGYVHEQGLGTAKAFRNTYTYEYDRQFGGYKELSVTVSTTAPNFGAGTTESLYDSRGNLVRQKISNPGETIVRNFISDAQGRIISKAETLTKPNGSESSGTQDIYYEPRQQVAILGQGRLAMAKFSSAYTPVSESYPGATPGNYIVNAGDTLASIAQAAFGDADLWYLIADANSLGFQPYETLPSTEISKSYHIPNVVGSGHNNADTFSPYDPARIIGNSTPSPGLPPGPATCGLVARMVATMIVIGITIGLTIATGGAVSPMMAPLVAMMINTISQHAAIGLELQQDFSVKRMLAAGLLSVFSGVADAATGQAALQSPDSIFKLEGGFNIGFLNMAQNALFSEVSNGLLGVSDNDTGGPDGMLGWGASKLVGALVGTLSSDPEAALFAELAGNGVRLAIEPNDWQQIAMQSAQAVGGYLGRSAGNALVDIAARTERERMLAQERMAANGSPSALSARAQAVLAGGLQLPGGDITAQEFLAGRADSANLRAFSSEFAGSAETLSAKNVHASMQLSVGQQYAANEQYVDEYNANTVDPAAWISLDDNADILSNPSGFIETFGLDPNGLAARVLGRGRLFSGGLEISDDVAAIPAKAAALGEFVQRQRQAAAEALDNILYTFKQLPKDPASPYPVADIAPPATRRTDPSQHSLQELHEKLSYARKYHGKIDFLVDAKEEVLGSLLEAGRDVKDVPYFGTLSRISLGIAHAINTVVLPDTPEAVVLTALPLAPSALKFLPRGSSGIATVGDDAARGVYAGVIDARASTVVPEVTSGPKVIVDDAIADLNRPLKPTPGIEASEPSSRLVGSNLPASPFTLSESELLYTAAERSRTARHAVIAIRNGMLKLEIFETLHPKDPGIVGRFKHSDGQLLTLYAPNITSKIQGAGVFAHEATHYKQWLTGAFGREGRGYHLGHELEANLVEARVNPRHWTRPYTHRAIMDKLTLTYRDKPMLLGEKVVNLPPPGWKPIRYE